MRGSDLFHYRQAIRIQMLADRDDSRCDLCERHVPHTRLEQHEVIARAKTVKGSEKRTASYDKHLCALLCRECHEKITRDSNRRIIERNIERYGYEAVKAAWDKVGVEPFAFPEQKATEMNDGYTIRVNTPPTQERTQEVARTIWGILCEQDDVNYNDLILQTGFKRTEIDAAFIHIALVFIASRGAKQIG